MFQETVSETTDSQPLYFSTTEQYRAALEAHIREIFHIEEIIEDDFAATHRGDVNLGRFVGYRINGRNYTDDLDLGVELLEQIAEDNFINISELRAARAYLSSPDEEPEEKPSAEQLMQMLRRHVVLFETMFELAQHDEGRHKSDPYSWHTGYAFGRATAYRLQLEKLKKGLAQLGVKL